jgi:predicted amidohydrolase
MSRIVRVAAAQYDIGFFSDWADYEAKLIRWVDEAAPKADLLLFPEYGAMELASLLPEPVRNDLAGQIVAMQDYLPRFIALHQSLATRHRIHLLAASFPVQLEPGRFCNRAHIFLPDGRIRWQDKLTMTRFEHEQWGISAGAPARVFETAIGTLGIAICYDAEFPTLVRAQVEAGAEIILVPSCTDGLAGYHRVRIGCQARALENQCVVIQSPTVGEAPWSEAVDVNVGAAGVFVPPDRGLPADGVLAAGHLNTPQWLFAEINLATLADIRLNGQVLNHRDWPPTPGFVVERQ